MLVLRRRCLNYHHVEDKTTVGLPLSVRPLSDIPGASPSIAAADLQNFLSEWLDDGEWRGHTAATLSLHRMVAQNLLWYIRHVSAPVCGLTELHKFFLYLQNSHAEEGGLWHDEARPDAGATRALSRKFPPAQS